MCADTTFERQDGYVLYHHKYIVSLGGLFEIIMIMMKALNINCRDNPKL